MDVRQQARQLTIARHRKQQPRSGRLRHQRIRNTRRQGDRNRGDELERRPTGDGGDGVEGVVDLRVTDELGPGGGSGLHDECDRHFAIADGGEDHRDETDHIGERHQAPRGVEDDADTQASTQQMDGFADELGIRRERIVTDPF